MCREFLVGLLLLPASLAAQAPDWRRVDVNIRKLDPRLAPARFSAEEQLRIVASVNRHLTIDPYTCVPFPEGSQPPLTIAPLGGHSLYVLSAECSADGNVQRWLLDMHTGHPRILADIEGWGLDAQPHVSHGLHDFVTTWHLGFDDFTLSYWRYDGNAYRRIAQKEVVPCKGRGLINNACYKGGGRPLDSTPSQQ